MAATPTAAFSFSAKVQLRNVPGVLGALCTAIGNQALELVDFAVRSLPLVGSSEPFDTFYQHSSIPRAVKERDIPGTGQVTPESPQVMLCVLILCWRCDWNHSVSPRIKCWQKPPYRAAFTRGVPAFEDRHTGYFLLFRLSTQSIEFTLCSITPLLVVLLVESLCEVDA